jgi:hypothetical protein
VRICEESIAVMRAGDRSDRELGGEMSATLSRLGFLQSLDDGRLEDARKNLEEARLVGEADHWVTGWNLANVLAREGMTEPALGLLDEVRTEVTEPNSWVTVLFTVPGRAPAESLVRATSGEGVAALFALQEAILEKDPEQFQAAIDEAVECSDAGVVEAAGWAAAAKKDLGVEAFAGELG